jgi:hypothetical protein
MPRWITQISLGETERRPNSVVMSRVECCGTDERSEWTKKKEESVGKPVLRLEVR